MNKETMIAPSAAERSEEFNQYLHHLTRYHGAMIMGRPDLAHQEREEMYAPYEALDEDQIAWLDEVSGDLYLLHGDETFRASSLPVEELAEKIKVAQDKKDGETLLKLLRQASTSSKLFRSHFRANAYSMLGFPRLSLMFRAFANALANTPDYGLLLLNDLRLFKAADLVKDYGLQLLNSASPVVRFFSAMVLYSSLQDLPEKERKTLLERCVSVLEKISTSNDLQVLDKKERVGLFVLLGSCYGSLGDKIREQKAYGEGLRLSPSDRDVLVLHGQSILASNPESAYQDFQKSVKLKTPVALPYFVLAREAMIAGDFRLGLKLSKAAYAFAKSDRAKGQAMEFVAICYHELGRPLDKVLQQFDQAYFLNPASKTLLHNRSVIAGSEKYKADSHTNGEIANYPGVSDISSILEQDDAVSQNIIDYINSKLLFDEQSKKVLDQSVEGQYSLAA